MLQGGGMYAKNSLRKLSVSPKNFHYFWCVAVQKRLATTELKQCLHSDSDARKQVKTEKN
jgi:hypothetical protein